MLPVQVALVFFLTQLGPPPGAAPSPFNGRWNIRADHAPRGRAWWLEVTGAGTKDLSGRFVGFPGGDLSPIPEIGIRDGVLRFALPSAHLAYSARYAGGRLEGTWNDGAHEWKWTGERAPQITDRDDDSWTKSVTAELFNHHDLSGWRPAPGWTVENGILRSSGGADNLASSGKFWNFLLHVEFKVGPHSNSGVALRNRYEVQIQDDYGKPVDRHTMGALYSRMAPSENACRPAGEWQMLDIRLVGRHVTVVLNGKKVVTGVIDGLTAMATDPGEAEPGTIVLQGDHGPVEFRSLVLTPLVQ
jgi:hypothetical protein